MKEVVNQGGGIGTPDSAGSAGVESRHDRVDRSRRPFAAQLGLHILKTPPQTVPPVGTMGRVQVMSSPQLSMIS